MFNLEESRIESFLASLSARVSQVESTPARLHRETQKGNV